jgi:hypothetical protein
MLGRLLSAYSLEERTVPIFVQSFIEDFTRGMSKPRCYVGSSESERKKGRRLDGWIVRGMETDGCKYSHV